MTPTLHEIEDQLMRLAGVTEVFAIGLPSSSLDWNVTVSLDASGAGWEALKVLTAALEDRQDCENHVLLNCEAIYDHGGMGIEIVSRNPWGLIPETVLMWLQNTHVRPCRVTDEDEEEESGMHVVDTRNHERMN